MAVDAVFRKLVTCALVASLTFNQLGSCASLSGESTVGGGSSSSSSLGQLGSSSSSSQLVGSPTLGSLYRSTRDEYGRYGGRDQRCGSCGGYSDRDMRSFGGRPGGIYGYYSGRGSIYDDRNWYYRPDAANDDRASYRGGDGYYSMRPGYMNMMMMGYDDRYMNRNDDRYYPMSTRGYYDNRGSGYYPPTDTGMRPGGYGYRGNGYDNLDPLYDHYMMIARGGGQTGGAGANYNRDRYYGASGGYGSGYDDRNRGGYGYDNKNFRPWDETYSRPPSSAPPSSAPGAPHHQQYPSPPSSPSSSSTSSHYHQSGYPGAAGPTGPAGTYTSQPIGIYHSSGPDRPDSYGGNRPCCAECCSSSSPGRYPPGPAGPTGTGAGYNQPYHHQQQQQPPPQPSVSQYGGERPDHGRPGAWNYLSGGSASAASGGGGGQDYHQASSAAGGSSYAQQSNQDYGNRGGYRRPGGDDRQQNTAYSPRPRPSSLGPTSYLLDRDGDNSVGHPSELHAAAATDNQQTGGADSTSSSSKNNIGNNNGPEKSAGGNPTEK
ncbi:spidroin-2 isoform X2 [Malaya genurostris]|uniref:spidroin-2 isoform X2 n=1 Tax=Malaya genurostris TaxID=325434 RepID=UPI0026F3BBF3|nr:spidroin-2 isoform X2 [Malaya genurostris]